MQNPGIKEVIAMHRKETLALAGRSKKILRYWPYYVMLLPAVVYFVIFKYTPMYGVLLAFKQFSYRKSIWASEWKGLEYFEELFSTSDFRTAVLNTLIISFSRILLTFAVPILVAVLINEIRNTVFRKTVQTFLYLPHFLSWVIMAGILEAIFTVNGGAVNKIIQLFGGTPENLLLSEEAFRPILYLSQLWKEVGWDTIIYIAALLGINPELYEAATVDGANRLQKALYITWPGIKSTVIIMLILTTSRVMYAGFDQIFNLYSAPVYSVGDIIDTYVYREFFLKSEFSLGTAAGLFKSVINVVIVLVMNKIAKLVNDGEGLL